MAGQGSAVLGVAIVGTGLAARMHWNALRLLPDVRVRGVVGTSPDKAEAFAREQGLPRGYRDLDELAEDREVQIVHLCTPPYTHVELARRLAQAGKHLLIDKPIARTAAEADAIVAAAQEAGVLLSGLFQNRFVPYVRTVKEAIAEGRLGDVYLADCQVKWWRDAAYYEGSAWRARWATEGGGALINQAIHAIDLLQWLAGPVEEVVGRIATVAHAIETEDLGLALLRLRGGRGEAGRGALGVLEGTTAAYPGFPERLEIHGTRGTVVLDQARRTVSWYLQGEAPREERRGEEQGSSRDPAAVSPEAHAAAFADFVDAVRRGRPPAVDGREAKKAVEIVEAVYRSSAAGGLPVRLPLTS